MTEPMSDKRLAAIKAGWHAFRRVELYRGAPEREAAMKDELVNHIPALLAEVDRLRQREAELEGDVEHRRKALEHANTRVDYLKAQNAAMREIVRQVAEADTYVWGLALPVHPKDADKLKAKARAFVAQWEPAE